MEGNMTQQDINQQGIVSIITVIFLSIILTLITIAFMRAMTGNQRQALDMQLNTQAFYAAESGYNDALQALKVPGALNIGSPNCSDFYSGNSLDNTLDNINRYTCLLVDSTVDYIQFEGNLQHGKLFLIQSSNPAKPIDSLRIFWSSTTNNANQNNHFRSDQSFPRAGNATGSLWSGTMSDQDAPSLLRLSVYPISSLSRDDLIRNQRTYFIVPRNGAASVNVNDGSINDAACSSTAVNVVDGGNYYCSVTVPVSSFVSGSFYIRILPFYSTSDVVVEGLNTGSRQQLVGAQTTIDVTGRSNDVYKRILYRKNTERDDYYFPEAVTKINNSICKQFQTWPGGSYDESGGACNPF
jgi:hypothetical protein